MGPLIPILKMRELRLRKDTELTQIHTTRKLQGQTMNFYSLNCQSPHLSSASCDAEPPRADKSKRVAVLQILICEVFIIFIP